MKRSGDRHRAGEVWVSLLSFYQILGSDQNHSSFVAFLPDQFALDDHRLADESGEGLLAKLSHIIRGENLRCIHCGGRSLWGGGRFRGGAGGFVFEREFLCKRVHVGNRALGFLGGLRCEVGDGERR